MSIIIENLSKNFGEQIAVNNISFEAARGEIVGFLGPNGAGKSTTLKMITGYLPPSSGSITVAGFNVAQKPLEVKRRIGYLPEHNPLYLDLYVKEYLNYVASLHQIPNKTNRINTVIEQTGLKKEHHKKISALSKGYRQRVGLAQAIIHDPAILILDEPTAGLDPNQLTDIRALIKTWGQDKTLIFSTHIMQEVEAICDRVIIIHQGRIVANDLLHNLQPKREEFTFNVVFGNTIEELALRKAIPTIIDLSYHLSNQEWTLKTTSDVTKNLFDLAVAHKTYLVKNQYEKIKLEDLFRQLTS